MLVLLFQHPRNLPEMLSCRFQYLSDYGVVPDHIPFIIGNRESTQLRKCCLS